MTKILPSILELPQDKVRGELDKLVGLADSIHVDVADGQFVSRNNLDKMSPAFIDSLHWTGEKNVHLMCQNPGSFFDSFIAVGSNEIIFHASAAPNAMELIQELKDKGVKAGVALNPDVSVEQIAPLADSLDSVLLMSVYPGAGGQSFIEATLHKIKLVKNSFPHIKVIVDGGINLITGLRAHQAGADAVVAGNYVFSNNPANFIALAKLIGGV